ncbi:hypothetical protein TNIN_488471 [Trichonephila inaurata madagascariensis]|uniref:Uncharacterized protein n=1 Tax=Trichonephila inaurata madagascariensis TaxID=2747483 RepID=A0A8X7C308_9ARAC|nr:hypothetical protein TNIN_488471 [Trichonephila inaurata madagascariensis]
MLSVAGDDSEQKGTGLLIISGLRTVRIKNLSKNGRKKEYDESMRYGYTEAKQFRHRARGEDVSVESHV